jgi:hypothetical protein
MLTRFSQIVFRYGRVLMDSPEEEDKNIQWTTWAKVKWAMGTMWYLIKSLTRPESVALEVDASSKVQTLEQLKFITSRAGILSLLATTITPWWSIAFLIVFLDPVSTVCYGCHRDGIQTAIIIAESVIMVAMTLVLTIRVRKLPDEWGMFMEGRLSLRSVMVSFIGLILVGFETTNPPNSYWDYQIILSLGLDAAFFCVSGLQVILGWWTRDVGDMKAMNRKTVGLGGNRKTVAAKSDNSGLEGNIGSLVDVTVARGLAQIVGDPDMLNEFERHLADEFSNEGISFLRAIGEWRSNFREVTSSTRAARARRIYRTYIHHSGILVVNLPATIKNEITRIMEGSNDDLVTITLFDAAKREVSRLLERDAVPRFRRKFEANVGVSTNSPIGASSEDITKRNNSKAIDPDVSQTVVGVLRKFDSGTV